MLAEKARDYESTSYRGLFNFIRYIENLKKYQVDFGEANVLSDKEDTVRIMSIHGSKGLEFPIVFVAGMGKSMNMQDARESLVLHPDLGIGAPCMDKTFRIRTKTILQKAVQQEIASESLGEELRILYVALTRAKEKLILTGTVSRLKEQLTGFEMVKRREEARLSYGMRTKGRTYMDWILQALARHRCMKPLYAEYELPVYPLNPLYEGEGDFLVRKVYPLELVLEETQLRIEEAKEKERLLSWDCTRVYDQDLQKEIEESFSYVYPYEAQALVPSKLTVSEVKRMQEPVEEESQPFYEQKPAEDYVPVFMREEEESPRGAARGTIYHTILENLDYLRTDSLKEIKAQIEELVQQGKLTEAMRKAVWDKDIETFVKSPLGQRMKKACEGELLYREQPFVMEVSANRIKAEYDSGEQVLIQGIMDAFFEENGELILVDYKTDYAEQEETLIERYKLQLDYYRRALMQMENKPVKETLIYSFRLGEIKL